MVPCRGLWLGQLGLQGSGRQPGVVPMKTLCWSNNIFEAVEVMLC